MKALSLTALAAVAALGLAGCGGANAPSIASLETSTTSSSTPGGTNTTGGAANSASSPSQGRLLKYAECMRAHGVPTFPDPRPLAGTPPGSNRFLGNGPNPSSSPTYRAASAACRKYAVAERVTPTVAAKVRAQQLEYAHCLRTHREPDFPDPGAGGGFTIPSSIDQSSPTFQAAARACQDLLPGVSGPPGS